MASEGKKQVPAASDKPAVPEPAESTAPEAPIVNTGLNRKFNVHLPSEGRLYEGKIPDGIIEARPMTTAEEAILYSAAGDGISKIDNIINACVITRDPDPKDLLLIDRFYILLMLRTRSFGGRYDFPVRCQGCQVQFKANVDLAEDLEVHPMAEDVIEPFEATLPINGDTLQMRFLRGRDEARIARQAKRVRMQSSDPADPSYLYRLALQIVGINGKDVQIVEAERYVRQLDVGDSAEMRQKTDELEGGADTRIYIDCTSCGYINEMELPFTAEFFRPNSRS